MLRSISCLLLVFIIFTFSSCDFIYRKLHKEGAQERELVGDINATEVNERVLEIQKYLYIYGYAPGAADGILGGSTRNAIRRFQQDNNLPVSGFVDYTTWENLIRFQKLGFVHNGELNVVEVQKTLKSIGFNPGALDGHIGPRTKQMIKEFQNSVGLKPDGRVGFKTLSALVKAAKR